MTYLLDTNVVSELRRPRPDRNVVKWIQATPDAQLHISVLTIGELRQGVEKLRAKDLAQAATIDTWLSELRATFADRLVGIDDAIAERWGRLNAEHGLPSVDGLLAATVLERGWTLVTRNVSDVQRSGARVLNPFEEI